MLQTSAQAVTGGLEIQMWDVQDLHPGKKQGQGTQRVFADQDRAQAQEKLAALRVCEDIQLNLSNPQCVHLLGYWQMAVLLGLNERRNGVRQVVKRCAGLLVIAVVGAQNLNFIQVYAVIGVAKF